MGDYFKVHQQLKFIQMRNTYPVFAEQAKVTCHTQESKLNIVWQTANQKAVLTADFLHESFDVMITDIQNKQVLFRFTQI